MVQRPVRTGTAALLVGWLCLCAAPVVVRAQESETFTLRWVAVDATATTATEARDAALAAGERRAWTRLLARLVPRADLDRLPNVSDTVLKDLIQDFEVADEKTSPVRYLATLTLRFKPGEVRGFLRRSGAGFAETVSKPMLVLPVMHIAGAPSLWDEPNPWRAAWGTLPAADGLVPFLLPKGDLADVADVSARQALDGDENRLSAIAARYGASAVLVAQVDVAYGSAGRAEAQVAAGRFEGGESDQTVVLGFVAADGEATEQLLRRAAAEVVRHAEEQWKRDNILQFGHEGRMIVRVPISGLGQWQDIRKRLDGMTLIRQSELVYLARTEARLDLTFLGDEAQLRLALAQRDLTLVHDSGGWRLSIVSARR